MDGQRGLVSRGSDEDWSTGAVDARTCTCAPAPAWCARDRTSANRGLHGRKVSSCGVATGRLTRRRRRQRRQCRRDAPRERQKWGSIDDPRLEDSRDGHIPGGIETPLRRDSTQSRHGAPIAEHNRLAEIVPERTPRRRTRGGVTGVGPDMVRAPRAIPIRKHCLHVAERRAWGGMGMGVQGWSTGLRQGEG